MGILLVAKLGQLSVPVKFSRGDIASLSLSGHPPTHPAPGVEKLRSGILDNSYLVRQMLLDPGTAPLLVRQRPGFLLTFVFVLTGIDNKH